MHLMLIRHGQSAANVAGILETRAPGPGLTALGMAQASALPDALQKHAVDGVYASALMRTQLTAVPLSGSRTLDTTVLPGLHEIGAGQLEGTKDPTETAKYIDVLSSWLHGDLGRKMPGGADGNAFLERFDNSVAHIAAAHPDGMAVAFSHGAAIRVWTALRAKGTPSAAAAAGELHNTAGVTMHGDPKAGWTITAWSASALGGAHLDGPKSKDITGHHPL
ncbi:MAG: histidine phosphatase family protein [Pseudolysinimonas sp.]